MLKKKASVMGEVKETKLYGFRLSTDCLMVHHALKLKGVAYEYLEEDPESQSKAVLLQIPVVDKKVPVLVVDGKPIAQPLHILEFVEEMWKDRDPPLLPEDPYRRARVRFWADFFYQKLVPTSYAIVGCGGEAQQRAALEFKKHLSTMEDEINEVSCGGPFINGERPGLLDVIVGSCQMGIMVIGEIAGMELLEKARMPMLWSCVAAFAELEVVKETMPSHDELMECLLALRGKTLAAEDTMAQDDELLERALAMREKALALTGA